MDFFRHLMKKICLTIVLSFLVTFLANAQDTDYSSIECEWDSRYLTTLWVRWDDEDEGEPEIWKEYLHSHHIKSVFDGEWYLPAPNGRRIHPTYIIFKNDDPTIFGACELAYNYFASHPKLVEEAVAKGNKKLEYKHKDFIVVVEIEERTKSIL